METTRKLGINLWTHIKNYWLSWLALVGAVVATMVFVMLGDCDLAAKDPPPRGDVLRNYGLLIAAFWGFFLAIWRGQIADKQVKTSEKGLRNGRYQKGTEMLGSEMIAVRLCGILALERLAGDYPDEYHIETMEIFSAIARYWDKDTDGSGNMWAGTIQRRTGNSQLFHQCLDMQKKLFMRLGGVLTSKEKSRAVGPTSALI